MAESIHEIPAAQRKLMLENMANSPAFALFLDRWEETVVDAIQAKINDLNTSDADTRMWKHAREAISGTHHPRKIVETLIRTTASERPKQ